MKTININGKEYTKGDFVNKIYTVPSISGLFENLSNFPRHEPEPPTVRPMSENSKRKLLKDFLEHVEAEIDYLQCEPSILIDSYIESLLPNPDDIKL